jgi:hypothetical protein
MTPETAPETGKPCSGSQDGPRKPEGGWVATTLAARPSKASKGLQIQMDIHLLESNQGGY